MKINIIKILLGFFLVALCFQLFKRKKTKIGIPRITILKDTVWQTKTDTVSLQTIKYKKVFVYKDNPTKILKDTVFVKQTNQILEAKEYRDTLQSNEIDIYSYSLSTGDLLKNEITYKLKVPKEIITTKTFKPP